jgi:hypothetical protein
MTIRPVKARSAGRWKSLILLGVARAGDAVLSFLRDQRAGVMIVAVHRKGQPHVFAA